MGLVYHLVFIICAIEGDLNTRGDFFLNSTIKMRIDNAFYISENGCIFF